MSKQITLQIKNISWSLPEALLDLEPLSDDAPLKDIIKRVFQEIPERVKEFYPEFPDEVILDITLEDDELEKDGKSIYLGLLASIVNYRLIDEYNYGATAMGDFIVLEGELNILDD